MSEVPQQLQPEQTPRFNYRMKLRRNRKLVEVATYTVLAVTTLLLGSHAVRRETKRSDTGLEPAIPFVVSEEQFLSTQDESRQNTDATFQLKPQEKQPLLFPGILDQHLPVTTAEGPDVDCIEDASLALEKLLHPTVMSSDQALVFAMKALEEQCRDEARKSLAPNARQVSVPSFQRAVAVMKKAKEKITDVAMHKEAETCMQKVMKDIDTAFLGNQSKQYNLDFEQDGDSWRVRTFDTHWQKMDAWLQALPKPINTQSAPPDNNKR